MENDDEWLASEVRDDVTCEKIVWERGAVNRGGNNFVIRGDWGSVISRGVSPLVTETENSVPCSSAPRHLFAASAFPSISPF